jgi:hypothetical protein
MGDYFQLTHATLTTSPEVNMSKQDSTKKELAARRAAELLNGGYH